MVQIFNGRHTARIDGPFVVFIIGMRINRLWALHRWVPVARAMEPMLRHLQSRPELGLLHAEPMLYWRGVALVQYWRSFEQLERFARDPSATHLEAWKQFNRTVGSDGSVGVWHETYEVAAGHYECIYNNMPARGLARAGRHEPVGPSRDSAAHRLGRRAGPAS